MVVAERLDQAALHRLGGEVAGRLAHRVDEVRGTGERTDGRLDLTALEVCVAMAVSSGSAGLEAAVALTDSEPVLDAVRDFAGTGVPVHVGDARGTIARSLTT